MVKMMMMMMVVMVMVIQQVDNSSVHPPCPAPAASVPPRQHNSHQSRASTDDYLVPKNTYLALPADEKTGNAPVYDMSVEAFYPYVTMLRSGICRRNYACLSVVCL